MQNLNSLRDEVFTINKGNGWHEQQRSFGELIALVHSEVSEALEDYRNGKAVNKVWYEYKEEDGETSRVSGFIRNGVLGKPCGIPSELADVVIRILDICGLYEWDIEEVHRFKLDSLGEYTFPVHLAALHKDLSATFDDEQNVYSHGVESYLDNVIQRIEYICAQYDIDLESIIRQKLEYNKTRGYKHGGKVI